MSYPKLFSEEHYTWKDFTDADGIAVWDPITGIKITFLTTTVAHTCHGENKWCGKRFVLRALSTKYDED